MADASGGGAAVPWLEARRTKRKVVVEPQGRLGETEGERAKEDLGSP